MKRDDTVRKVFRGDEVIRKAEVFGIGQHGGGAKPGENVIVNLQSRQKKGVISIHKPETQHGEEVDNHVNHGGSEPAAGEHDAQNGQAEEKQEHDGDRQQP